MIEVSYAVKDYVVSKTVNHWYDTCVQKRTFWFLRISKLFD